METAPSLLEELQSWGKATMGFGIAGAAVGSFSAFLNGQHAMLHASAYGANSMLAAGAVLGTRAIAQHLLPPALTDDLRWVTAGSSALVGAGASALVAGRRRAPAGAALWAAGGFAGQHVYDRVQAWREAEARALGVRPGGGKAGAAAGAASAAMSAASFVPLQVGSRGTKEAAAALPSPPPYEGGILGPRVPWGWLPFTTDVEVGEERRVRRLRARIEEIDDALGLTPASTREDPRLGQVRALEARATAARLGSGT
jgi:hypothetical protein